MSPAEYPNVLVIHADQHRADCIGAYGNAQIRTPHLDALAADGVVYTDHFCSYPACTPSRYSLLCGQQVHQHLCWNNQSTLPPGIETFPGIMRRAGYSTEAIGKMHFTPTYLDVGFSRMHLAEQDGDGRLEDDYHDYLCRQGLLDAVDLYDQRAEYRAAASPGYWESFGAQASDLPVEHHSTTYITDEAERSVEQWSGGGNLLMVGYIKPHHPFDPPEPYASLYDPDLLELLPGYTDEVPEDERAAESGYFDFSRLDEAALRRVMAMYYGTISQIDDGVGRLIAMLKSKGLYERTIIVYTSDHGEYLGFHHLLLKGHRMYDPLVRIPLIVKPAGRGVVAGEPASCSRLSSNTDIAAHLLEACGLEPAPGMSRAGLRPDRPGRSSVIAEHLFPSDGRVDYMIRTQRYKLLLTGGFDDARLYDLAEDPLELCDLSAESEHAALREELTRLLCGELLFRSPSRVHRDHLAPTAAPLPPPELARRRRRLRAWHAQQTGIVPR